MRSLARGYALPIVPSRTVAARTPPFSVMFDTRGYSNSVTLTAKAFDSLGRSGSSSITILLAAPGVEISSPLNGGTYGGNIPITASAFTPAGTPPVQTMQAYINGTLFAQVNGATLSAIWNSAAVPNPIPMSQGIVLVEIKAISTAGISTIAQSWIHTNNNGPSVSLYASSLDSYVRGQVTVSASVSDWVLLNATYVELKLNGVTVASQSAAPSRDINLSYAWNTLALPDGEVTFEVLGRNSFGNEAHAKRTYIVVNTPATVAMTEPVTSGTVPLGRFVPVKATVGGKYLTRGCFSIDDWDLSCFAFKPEDVTNQTLATVFDMKSPTRPFISGPHTARVWVYNASGMLTSKSIPFTLDGTEPWVTMIQPERQLNQWLLNATVIANDLREVRYKVRKPDGSVLLVKTFGTSGATPFTWDATGMPYGDYAFICEAEDQVGNVNIKETPFTISVPNLQAPVVSLQMPWKVGMAGTQQIYRLSATVTDSNLYNVQYIIDGPATNHFVIQTQSVHSGSSYVYDFWDLNLPSGMYTATILATDQDGNQGQDAKTFYKPDRNAPEITVSQPSAVGTVWRLQAGVTDADNNLSFVEFSITGPNSNQVVKTFTTAQASYTFDWDDLYYPYGDYVFRVKATDAAGNVTTAESTFKYDEYSGLVGIYFDNPNWDYETLPWANDVTLRVVADSPYSFAQVELIIDGTSIGLAQNVGAGAYELAYNTRPLAVGADHYLEARALDSAGRTTTTGLTFYLEVVPDTTPPVLNITNITPNQVLPGGTTIPIQYTVTDSASGVGPWVVCYLTQGNGYAEVLTGSPMNMPVSGSAAPGSGTLTCLAWDNARNMARRDIPVSVTPAPLTVRILEPYTTARPGDVLHVVAEVTSPSPIATVEVWRDDVLVATLTAPPFEADMPLEDYYTWNDWVGISVVARDVNGYMNSDDTSVLLTIK
jgi:hypothetical protein